MVFVVVAAAELVSFPWDPLNEICFTVTCRSNFTQSLDLR